MTTKGKLSFNPKEDLWKSLIEHDEMLLRTQLNGIRITIENELRNYNMNSNEGSVSFM